MRIKMCGMTREQDALMAANLGADAIGLVFVKESPRCVDVARATEIVGSLPVHVARVGVFVNESAETIRHAVNRVGLTAIQLHGDEEPAFVAQLELSVPVIKAMAFGPHLNGMILDWKDNAVLVDHATPALRGGTGFPWDWSELSTIQRPASLIVAGGLDAENVAGAARTLEPDAVDVASGIESQAGIKDVKKMRAFVKACAPFRKNRRPFLS
jgi:phosphoribosylanthranilate isomerase